MFWILQVGFVFLMLGPSCLVVGGHFFQNWEKYEEEALILWRSGYTLYFVYMTLNTTAHCIFATKYWSLARKLKCFSD
jgi:hypothetical protein